MEVDGDSSDWASDFLCGTPLVPDEVIAPAYIFLHYMDGALEQRIRSEVNLRLGGAFQKQALDVLIGAFPKELEGTQCLHDAIVRLVAFSSSSSSSSSSSMCPGGVSRQAEGLLE